MKAVDDDQAAFSVRALGTLSARRRGDELDLGGPKQRLLLALLLAQFGRVVRTEQLIDGLWGDEPPPTARKALQVHISNLRRRLGDDFPLKTAPGGYLVQASSISYDVAEFERLVGSGTAVLRGDVHQASQELGRALAMWTGPAFADLADEPAMQPEVVRLNDLRLLALERRIDADLRLGRHVDLVGELETLTLEHPYRERFCEQHLLALYRSGRQTEALRAYDRTRRRLIDELGIEPAPSLQELHTQILSQSTDLDHDESAGGERFAFLATDLEDSTGLWETDPESMQAALARHDELLAGAVEGCGGTVFKATGDGIFAVFPWIGDAVRAAVDAQLALSAEQWGTSSALRVRMGVDEGPATSRDGDFFGPALNRVSRIMSSGHGGQIVVPASLADRVDVELIPLGPADYKGVGRLDVAQVTAPGLATEFAPLRTDRAPSVPMREGFGRAIRGYELREQLGAGADGIVYRAYQSSVGREVAIKVIRHELANRTEFVKRFEAEAQYVAQLEHPHIAPLYDYWRDPDGAYLVMQLLRGGNLADALERSPWRPPAAMRLLDQVGAALDYAHRHGVIHRDLKPANVLLDADGNGFLSDFGIARHHVQAQGHAIESSVAYVAPEELAGDPAGVASDMYALTLLANEVLTATRPSLGDQPAPVSSVRPDLPPAVDRVLARGSDPDPDRRYQRVAEFLRDLRDAFGATLVSSPAERPRAETRNPFKGLRAFRETDAQDFFGRDELVADLLAHVGRSQFTAVVGPSGSGKSSVVRAGLLPAIRRGGLDVNGAVLIAEMYPGAYPFEELAAALGRVAVEPTDGLIDELLADPRGLVRACKRILPDDDSELVLVVDQFEELFSLTADEGTRRHFLSSLVEVVRDERSRVRVVATLRADFFDRPLEYPDFGAMLGERVVPVALPRDHELAAAIVEPARSAGLEFEPGLISQMVNDVRDEPGALPLLQYALTVMVDDRTSDHLGLGDYERIGRASGAMAAQAEEAYAGLSHDAREAAREVFLRLVTVSEHDDDTRRRALRSELDALGDGALPVAAVVSAYGSLRLLSFDRDPHTRGQTVEVAHEALIREWPRFGEWIEDRRESLLLERRLDGAVAEWERSNRDDSMLLSGGRLAQYEQWLDGDDVPVPPDHDEFLDRSREASESAERRRSARRRRVTGLVAALAVMATLAAVVAWTQRGEADRQADAARAQERAAQDEAERAVAAEAAATDAAAVAEQLRLAAEQQQLVEEAQRLAVDSIAAVDDDADLAVLLAIEAAQRAEAAGVGVPRVTEALYESTIGHRIDRRLAAWDVAFTNRPIASASAQTPRFAAIVEEGGDGAGRAVQIVDMDADDSLTVDVASPTSVAWSSDADEVAVGTSDGRILIIDPNSGRTLQSIDADGPYAKADDLTGQWMTYLVPSSGDPTVPADPASDLLTTDLVVLDRSTNAVALRQSGVLYSEVSPSGRYVFVLRFGGVSVYDIASGELVSEPKPTSGVLVRIDWIPGSDVLTWSANGRLHRLDIALGEQSVRPLPPAVGDPNSLEVSPDGRFIAVGDPAGSVFVLDAMDLTVVARLKGHASQVADLDWLAGGRGLVSLGRAPSSQLLVWDLERPATAPDAVWAGSRRYPIQHAVSERGSLTVLSSDFNGGEPLEEWADGSWSEPFVDTGASGFVLADAASSAGLVSAWEAGRTGAAVFDLADQSSVLAGGGELSRPIAVSPDGGTLVAQFGDAITPDGTYPPFAVIGVDVASGERLWALDGASSFTNQGAGATAGFADGGEVLILATSPSQFQEDEPMFLLALETRTGVELARQPLPERYTQVVVSPSDDRFATADESGSVTVFDLGRFVAGDPSPEIGSVELTAKELVLGMAFSDDGELLLLPAGYQSPELLAYSVGEDMELLWTIESSIPMSAPQVRNGSVWIAALDESLGDTARDFEFGLIGLPLDTAAYTGWAETVPTRPLTEAECERYLGGSCSSRAAST